MAEEPSQPLLPLPEAQSISEFRDTAWTPRSFLKIQETCHGVIWTMNTLPKVWKPISICAALETIYQQTACVLLVALPGVNARETGPAEAN